MKKVFFTFFLLILITGAQQLSAQGRFSLLKAKALKTEQLHAFNNRFFLKGLKRDKVVSHVFQNFSKRSISPKVSVDILDGQGIHLFTISDVDFLPTINVGARIKAGIKITI